MDIHMYYTKVDYGEPTDEKCSLTWAFKPFRSYKPKEYILQKLQRKEKNCCHRHSCNI